MIYCNYCWIACENMFFVPASLVKTILWTLEDQNEQSCTECWFCLLFAGWIMYRPLNVIYVLLHFIHFFFSLKYLVLFWFFFNKLLYSLSIYNIHMWYSFIILLVHFVERADRSIHFTTLSVLRAIHTCRIVANTHCSYKLYIQHVEFPIK